MHHPLIDLKELRKMPEEKIQDKISDLRKRRNTVIKINSNIMILEQIESIIAVYMEELHERTAKRIAKDKDEGTDLDDLINIE